MKSPVAYYLLLLYAVACCKPFLPLVSDVLAHALWETEHLQSVHQQHGKNHLHTELNDAAAHDAADANTTTGKSAEPVAVHLLAQFDFHHYNSCSIIQNPVYNLPIFIRPFLEKYKPPPKAAYASVPHNTM